MKTNYRPDIDGLRAMAVSAVIAFHYFPIECPGGFVGVDIFFVISGYLISRIIFKALDEGKFSFKDFYFRRINRIFPALLFMIIFCYGFGWFALYTDEFKQLGKHIAGGASFISNFILWRESGYFDAEAELKPLLHLWSLGIEEQFYIVWPIFLYLAWMLRRHLLFLLSLMTFLSFALNMATVDGHKVGNFYFPLTRFWELCFGSLLAYFALYKKSLFPSKMGTFVANLKSLLGVALIGGALYYFDKNSPFPGWRALVPTLGTVFLISAGEKSWFNRYLLSNPLLVWIGLISFPLYLWHWPLLSLATIVDSTSPSLIMRAKLIFLSIVLAWVCYQFLEQPLRSARFQKTKVAILSSLMIAIGYIGFFTFQNQGLKDRMANQNLSQDLIIDEIDRQSDGSCEKFFGKEAVENEICQAKSDQPEIMIIGDSHAMAFNSAIHKGSSKLNSLLIAGSGCLPFRELSLFEPKTCNQIMNSALELAKNKTSIKTVLLISRGPYYFSQEKFGEESLPPNFQVFKGYKKVKMKAEEAFVQGYTDMAKELLALGKKVIFVIDVPELGFNPRNCVGHRPVTLTNRPPSDCTVERLVVEKRQHSYKQLVNKIQDQSQGLLLYDTLPAFCDSSTCYAKEWNRIFYFDDDHLSISDSLKIIKHFQEWAEKKG